MLYVHIHWFEMYLDATAANTPRVKCVSNEECTHFRSAHACTADQKARVRDRDDNYDRLDSSAGRGCAALRSIFSPRNCGFPSLEPRARRLFLSQLELVPGVR